MTDRELLELAAKAAGIEHDADATKPNPNRKVFFGLWLVIHEEPYEGQRRYWNPLTNDGDALRLAVKLKMFLDLEYCCAKSIDNPWFGGGEDNLAGVNHDEDDPYAATRRAIVRAAAEIGKEQA